MTDAELDYLAGRYHDHLRVCQLVAAYRALRDERDSLKDRIALAKPGEWMALAKETDEHDMFLGPCKCGAWHENGDYKLAALVGEEEASSGKR